MTDRYILPVRGRSPPSILDLERARWCEHETRETNKQEQTRRRNTTTHADGRPHDRSSHFAG